MLYARLPAKIELELGAPDRSMSVAQGGKSVRAVLLCVFLIADAHERGLEQPDDGGNDLLAGQALALEVALDAASQARQGLGEGDRPLVLRLVARLAPQLVIAVLLSPPCVTPGGLDVAARVGAYPHLGPRRRDCQGADTRERLAVSDRRAVGAAVRERLARLAPRDARFIVVDIAQPDGTRGQKVLVDRDVPRHPHDATRTDPLRSIG